MTIKDFLSTTKRKLGVGIISGALIISAGAMTAFAAKADNTDINTPSDGNLVQIENGTASYSTDGGTSWNEGLPEDGNTQYSLDEGQTWNDGLPPEGSGEKSLVVHGNGTPPAPGEGDSMMVQNQDGVMRYSTDGGQTWSEGTPDGAQVTEDGGKVTIQREAK